MYVAEVVGNVWGQYKHPSLQDKKRLVVRPIDPLTEEPRGPAVMALDGGVRAVAAYNSVSARLAIEHDDANVLCLGGKTHGELAISEMLVIYFTTKYEGGRHDRRLAKIAAIEAKYSR